VQGSSEKKLLAVLGRNLNRIRREKGLSQDQLAVKADVTKRYIQMIESGQKCPKIFTIKRLQAALGCSWDDLLES